MWKRVWGRAAHLQRIGKMDTLSGYMKLNEAHSSDISQGKKAKREGKALGRMMFFRNPKLGVAVFLAAVTVFGLGTTEASDR